MGTPPDGIRCGGVESCTEPSFTHPGTSATRSAPIPPSSSPPTPSCAPSPPASAGRTCGATAASRRCRKPTPIGHEYCGVVEAVGDAVTTVKLGDFVVGGFLHSDNTCPVCRKGAHANCQHGGGYDGCQAEQDPHPARRRHPARHPGAAGRRPDPQHPRAVRRDVHRLARRRLRRRRPGQERRRRRRRRGRAVRGARRRPAGRDDGDRDEPARRPPAGRAASSAPPTSSPSVARPASRRSRSSPTASAPTASWSASAPRTPGCRPSAASATAATSAWSASRTAICRSTSCSGATSASRAARPTCRAYLPHLLDLVLARTINPGPGLRPRAAAVRGRRGLRGDGRAPRDQVAGASLSPDRPWTCKQEAARVPASRGGPGSPPSRPACRPGAGTAGSRGCAARRSPCWPA